MLQRMCAERSKDWDRYLPSLLFAVREVSHESLGFSPFELLYGRNVRGPMAVLRELWTDEMEDEEVRSTYDYVINLRKRLEHTCELAMKNLQKGKGNKRCITIDERNLVLSKWEIKFYYYSPPIGITYYYNGGDRSR